MSLQVEIVRIDGTTRRVDSGGFPLSIGGADGDIEVAGVSGSAPVAWLGQADGDLFLQAGEAGERVLCNGAPIQSSHWLHVGDEVRVGATRIELQGLPGGLRLAVSSAVEEVATEPPVLDTAATAEPPPAVGSGTTFEAVEFRPRRVEAAPARRWRIRPLTLGLWFGLALLAGTAWLLFTMRSIELRAQPEPDHLEVEGPWPILHLGDRWVLRPGSYTVRAEKQGFRPLRQPLVVRGATPPTIDLTLEMLPGLLIVDVGSIVGAEVLINGESQGTTPLGPFELPAGEYDVRVRAQRYAEFAERVSIEGLGRTQTVVAEMPGRWARVTFRSTPDGATVMLDNKTIGKTPLEVELLEGRHAYALTHEGYNSYNDVVSVDAGEPRVLPAVKLEWADATLRLTSRPDGANVTVDGEFRGRTPLDLALPPQRSFSVEVSKAGYVSQTREITLKPGEVAEQSLGLAAMLGEVAISATPPGAGLRIDGQPAGNANTVVTLPAIPHELEVFMRGYETYRTTVTPRPGFPQEIEVALVTPEERERASTPETIRTAQGHEMVLVRGGRFQMGASRREPGRRANETQHDVELSRPFYVSTGEISNEEYREYDTDHLSGSGGGYHLENDHHPVVQVTWEEAALFCNWLSTKESLSPVYARVGGQVVAARPLANGYRLPTEAEWAWVARYAGGEGPQKYPWGQELPVASNSGNYADSSAEGLLSSTVQGYSDGYPVTSPVDGFEPNPIGVFNLGGNVAEWAHDVYTIYPSGRAGIEIDPAGPTEGDLHVIRGSSWMDSNISELRLTYRDYGKDQRPDLGFRIARYAK